jgi:hypothetical protein
MQPTIFPFYEATPSVNTVLLIKLTEKKWENLASANIKKVKGAKHEKLKKTLAIWTG